MLAGFLHTENLAEVIHGLSEAHLVPLSPEEPGIKLTSGAAQAFRELQELARQDGLNLRVASGFRSFERQFRIFSGKMDGSRPVLDRNERPLDTRDMNPEELIRAILVFSAVPGLSRHHFGTDIDVYDPDLVPEGGSLELTNLEYREGPQAPVSHWLEEHMKECAFFRPYLEDTPWSAGELWHISYAPDADVLTAALSPEESLAFIRGSALPGKEILAKIIAAEFTERFRLFSPGASLNFQVNTSNGSSQ